MCVHPYVNGFDYPYRDLVNPMLEAIARQSDFSQRTKKMVDKYLNAMIFGSKQVHWTPTEQKDLWMLFLSRFVPLRNACIPPAQECQNGEDSSPLLYHTVYVKSYFCKCFDLTPKMQKVVINSIFRHDDEGNRTRRTILFGCPWYIIVVLCWIEGSALNEKFAQMIQKYESMLQGKLRPADLSPEEVNELRFASIMYHLSIEDLFYINKQGQMMPELIRPDFCLEIPEEISLKLIYETLRSVFGFKKVTERGWDQCIEEPNTSFEILVSLKRKVVSNDRHGPFEDFLGYINEISGPRRFLDKKGRETDVLMSWMKNLHRPGPFPLSNPFSLNPVSSLAPLFNTEKYPLTFVKPPVTPSPPSSSVMSSSSPSPPDRCEDVSSDDDDIQVVHVQKASRSVGLYRRQPLPVSSRSAGLYRRTPSPVSFTVTLPPSDMAAAMLVSTDTRNTGSEIGSPTYTPTNTPPAASPASEPFDYEYDVPDSETMEED